MDLQARNMQNKNQSFSILHSLRTYHKWVKRSFEKKLSNLNPKYFTELHNASNAYKHPPGNLCTETQQEKFLKDSDTE